MTVSPGGETGEHKKGEEHEQTGRMESFYGV